MPTYASKTEVSADRSRAEIERTLTRYGASGFAYAWEDTRAMIGFKMRGWQIRFELELPVKDDKQFLYTPVNRQRRTAAQAQAAWEQATRQRWRALALIIKAKLEAVEAGIRTFEQEFTLDTVLPNGLTVQRWLLPQMAEVARSGAMPPLLPGIEPRPMLPGPQGDE